MNSADSNINLLETYFGVLRNLSADTKLELISMLSKSMKSSKSARSSSLKSLYGAFISDKSADELIDDIKKARTFNNKREEF